MCKIQFYTISRNHTKTYYSRLYSKTIVIQLISFLVNKPISPSIPIPISNI